MRIPIIHTTKKIMVALLLCLVVAGLCWPAKAQEPAAGEITLHIEIQPGAPDILFPDEERLFAAILSNDDKENAGNGHDVEIHIVVRPTKTPWDAGVIEKGEKDYDLGMYMDISIYKEMEEIRTQVTRLNGPIQMRVQIPESLKGYSDYAMIRSHLGEGVILPNLEESEEEIVVESDEFSTYAILHKGETKIKEDNTELGLAILMGIGILAFVILVFAVWRKMKA